MTSTRRGDASSPSERRCESSACVQVDVYEGEHLAEPVVRVLSTQTDTRMQIRISEWRKFVAEIKNGDWDHVDTDWEIVAYTDPLRGQLNALVDAAEHKAR